jgi:arylsulfatase A-like enzyme
LLTKHGDNLSTARQHVKLPRLNCGGGWSFETCCANLASVKIVTDSTMKTKSFPWIAGVLLPAVICALPGSCATAPAKRPPNILLIVSDDLGYADLGVQGCKDIPTPNIDSLARNGVRFTSGYVSCPVCSPTRAGLMTGRYQQRFGHELNPGPAQSAAPNFGLPLEETTLADRLKKLGYVTGAFGKWHLGYKPAFHPMKRGFDEFYGFLGGAHSYIDNRDDANPVQDGGKPVAKVTYTTDMFAAAAADFISRNKDKPFFVYLPFNAVHTPLQAKEQDLNRFESIPSDPRRTLAAMLFSMDAAVGRVLGRLRELKLEEETLIFFISDNGGPTVGNGSRNNPLRGLKGQVYEGGIRVPFLIQWRSHLPAGKVDDRPVIALDILPTAVAAAGGGISAEWKLDGVNLLPYLTGDQKGTPHENLFWRLGEQHAVRQGDWKLLVPPHGSKPELYNLAKDIGEVRNVADQEPEKLQALQKAYDEWGAQLAGPKWKGNRRAAKRAAAKVKEARN